MIHRVILYGSGKRCRILCRILQYSSIEIITVVDSDPDKWGRYVEGYQIESPGVLYKYCEEYVCITVADLNSIREIRNDIYSLCDHGLEKEIHYNRLILEAYKQCSKIDLYINRWSGDRRKKANILFDCYNGLILGGVEAWTIDLCKGLMESKAEEIYILSDNGNYDVPDFLKGHIVYVNIDHEEQFSMRSVKNLVEAILEKLPCKIVTCTTNEIMLAAYLVKLYFPDQIQIISVIHNSNERVYEEYMDFRECPDIYIGVSQDIIRDMRQRGIEKNKLYSMACPFACKSILFRNYSEDMSKPIFIGYAGRIEYLQKRMDLLIKLIEILVREKVHFKMELAGDGVARRDIEEFVTCRSLDEKVRFVGRIDRSEIPSFWENKDICVNLSDYEGRSIGIIEAMGNGVIPVVTATSGVREDITDDVNGYIVPLEDYAAAANRIRYLDKHRERLNEMGRLAHDAVYPKSLREPHLKFWREILQ